VAFLFFLRLAKIGERHDRETDTLFTSADRGGGVNGLRGGGLSSLREGGGYLCGQNGKIAYAGYDDLAYPGQAATFEREIYTINADGGGTRVKLTSNDTDDFAPS
jgi:hypothetical protein